MRFENEEELWRSLKERAHAKQLEKKAVRYKDEATDGYKDDINYNEDPECKTDQNQ